MRKALNMAVDKSERAYSKEKSKSKRQTEPFVMLGSEMLNSAAYKDLSFSARAMLIEVLHYYTGKNNGRIWISADVLKERGFSKNTVTRALNELTSHGFIWNTKKGGNMRGVCSWFALTWFRIDKAEGQHLENFTANAFQKWKPVSKKIKGSKNGIGYPKFGELLGNGSHSYESKEIQINTNTTPIPKEQIPYLVTYKDITIYTPRNNQVKRTNTHWLTQDLKRLQQIGLAGFECYQTPTNPQPNQIH